MSSTWFERHPKKTLTSMLVLGVVLVVWLINTVGEKVFGLGHPVLYQTHPVYGYRPAPNQTMMRNHQLIKINNLGLRADNDWDPLQIHHKVLFVGDSVSYGGSYISNQQLFSHLAVAPFQGYVAGNAGVNGWGVDNVCALIQSMNFMPAEIIVSTFPEGDFYRGLNRIGGQPFWTVKPRFALEELFQFGIYKLSLKKQSAFYFYTLPESEHKHVAELAVMHLKALDDYLKSQGRVHLIFISPSRTEIIGKGPIDHKLKDLFAQYGLNVIYIQDKLPLKSEPEMRDWFYDEIHLSVAGHQQWAEVMANELRPLLTVSG